MGYTGDAARETKDGVTSQSKRNLDHPTSSTSVVRPSDLQPDPTPLPRTGKEKKEEEARSTMTQGEQDNLDQAIDDYWDKVFGSGPSL